MAQTTFFSYRDVTNIIVLAIVETKNGEKSKWCYGRDTKFSSLL